MHSGFLLLLWMVGAAALQRLSPIELMVALVVSVAVAWRTAPARAGRLFRRVRILLIAICIFFAGLTPGEAIWPAFPSVSPSREGLLLAFEHGARLTTVVLWVALLLEHLPPERLIGGIYALLRPLAGAGLPSERLAVRLMLVLSYVESAPAGAWRHWLESSREDGEVQAAIGISRESLGWREGVLAAALCAIGLAGALGAWA